MKLVYLTVILDKFKSLRYNLELLSSINMQLRVYDYQ